jgi:hypothetical protein
MMTPKLTEEMRQALAQSKAPLRIVDEQSNTAYVLLTEEDYAELKSAPDEADIEPREMYPTMWQIMKEDWNDPAMDVYDRNQKPSVPNISLRTSSGTGA